MFLKPDDFSKDLIAHAEKEAADFPELKSPIGQKMAERVQEAGRQQALSAIGLAAPLQAYDSAERTDLAALVQRYLLDRNHGSQR